MSAAVTHTDLARLVDAIYRRYHHDFRAYARASLARRVTAAITQLGCATIAELERRVLDEPRAFTELLRFLTVQVTELFRDPTYFRFLRDHVLPRLTAYPSLKLWVAGCATGEEAYSLAILLAEAGLLDRTLIYATDIHPASLRVADAGVYDLSRFATFSESYRLAGGRGSLSDYYYAVGYSSAVFDRALKKAIYFSDHSLATDGSFAEVQLVSCRNVLIYFERELQDRAIGLVGDSLCQGGFLGLGRKETLLFSSHAGAFEELSPSERVYQRLGKEQRLGRQAHDRDTRW